jgi:hypothetical protein
LEELCAKYASGRKTLPLELKVTPIPNAETNKVIGIGQYFPFKNRVNSRSLLLNEIQSQYERWMKRATFTNDGWRKGMSYILVGGAPGMKLVGGSYFLRYRENNVYTEGVTL